MPEIIDLLDKSRIKELLRQFSDAFGTSVILLDKNEDLLFTFPENMHHTDLMKEPVYLRDSIVGYVGIPKADNPPRSSLCFIGRNMTEIIGMGFEVDSLSGEVAKNYEELSLLRSLSTRLGAALNVDKICNELADEVMNFCPSKNVSILLRSDMLADTLSTSYIVGSKNLVPESRKTMLFTKVALGAYSSSASMMSLSTDRGLLKHAFDKKEPLTVCDVSADERFEGFTYPVSRLLIVPLIVEDSFIGAIVATDKLDGEEFFSTEIKLLFSIASYCAISIKKALLYDGIRSLLFSTAEAFSLTIEAKDVYTYGHSKRVSDIAAEIFKELGLPPEIINWIRLAALLHDIGKIGTPENILNKKGRLDIHEMDMVKQHPLSGAKMIEQIPMLRDLSQWILHHHERYDGSGYPSRLSGDSIPMPSRVIAIADVFDALTSDRSYRKAYTKGEALKIMRESLGKELDPVLFGYFEKIVSLLP
ncbi:MAG: HD domain-containing protein [Nitrospirota bacterium]|nr:HD domain-containing protein [Nitrospirota bacterium]